MLWRIAHPDFDTSLGRHALTGALCLAFWLLAVHVIARVFG